jgi:hypothetical protein
MRATFGEALLLEATNNEFEDILWGLPNPKFISMSIGLNSCKPIIKVAIPVNRWQRHMAVNQWFWGSYVQYIQRN